jgi:hypothetical protein
LDPLAPEAAPAKHEEPLARALATGAALAVLYAGLCKALLFRGLEYVHTDFFGFVEMSRSLFQHGELLRDNVYGYHAAIHNYYLMLLFAPLTLPLGAYGLVLGLALVHLAAVLRAASAPSLDDAARVVVLGASLSPIAFFVFDNPVVGFNPELSYPPLAVLFALDLREGRFRRALVPAALASLAKEDGVVLCASVLVAFFAQQLWERRAAPPAERRAVVKAAALSLLATVVVFVAGMALLALMTRVLPPSLMTAEGRLQDAFHNMGRALSGHGLLRENLVWGLAGYAGVVALLLLPLGRRLGRGLLLALAASPPLLAVLVVSSGTYRFRYMLWPHRVAPLVGLALACVVLACAARARPGRRALAAAAGFVALSWGLQLFALRRSEGYLPRLWAPGLAAGEGTRSAQLPPEELGFLRCLGERLPRGLPVSAVAELHPVFHQQSIVFEAITLHARQPPRLRVVAATATAPAQAGSCRDPGVGDLAVEADCVLAPVAAACRAAALGR